MSFDKDQLQGLHLYISNCIRKGEIINMNALIEMKGVESQIALCLKVLQSYNVKPNVLNAHNCDLWWNVMVCGSDDHNVGGVYGYDSYTSRAICNKVSKYIVWFLLHWDKDILWTHNNLKTIKRLISLGMYSTKSLTRKFITTKDKEALLNIMSKEEWYYLLCKSSGYCKTTVERWVDEKFTPVKKKTRKKTLKELVYS